MSILYLVLAGMAAAIAPCPLASNLAAIGYMSRHVGSHHRALMAAGLYTLGRICSYVAVGLLISQGLAGAPAVSLWLQESLPLYMGPILIVSGLVVLECVRVPAVGRHPGKKVTLQLSNRGLWGSFVLGLLFALALCPPSAALFFGTALPIAIQSGTWAWVAIALFGLGTSIPVAAFALLLVTGAEKAAGVLRCLPVVQRWGKILAGSSLFLLGMWITITELII